MNAPEQSVAQAPADELAVLLNALTALRRGDAPSTSACRRWRRCDDADRDRRAGLNALARSRWRAQGGAAIAPP